MKTVLKTPITYYGGKQQLLPKLLPLIPQHSVYVEPFFGGGALFFAKEKVKIEAINDTNNQVINFYKVVKKQFKNLKLEIESTLYSETDFLKAQKIYKENSEDSTEQNAVLRAWSLFVVSQQSFLNILTNTWKFGKNRNLALTFNNKKKMFDERYIERLEHTQIFCRDANRVLKYMDCEEAFHFIDPPYFNSYMGHYGGYTAKDFTVLLETCENLKGKFLLTTFPSEELTAFTQKNGWYSLAIEMTSSAKTQHQVKGRKIEVFTSNFPLVEAEVKAKIEQELSENS